MIENIMFKDKARPGYYSDGECYGIQVRMSGMGLITITPLKKNGERAKACYITIPVGGNASGFIQSLKEMLA